jgi:hypothetical protein
MSNVVIKESLLNKRDQVVCLFRPNSLHYINLNKELLITP